MIRGARTVIAASGLAAVLLAGCAVGPDFHRPAAPTVAAFTPTPPTSADQGFAMGADVPARWWTLFRAPGLDALVDEAVKANPDLSAAQASLRQAHELYLAQIGGLLPSVDLSGQASRQRDSLVVSPTLADNQPLYSLYNGQVSVAYPLDLFGGLRRGVENAKALAEQQRYQYEAAYLTLTANVAAAAIQEAGLRAQIAAAEQILAADKDLLDIERQQLKFGQVAGADVATQSLAFAQAQASLPPLRKALAQQRDLIAALAGRLPTDPQGGPLQLADLTLPASVPVSVPARLVDQRPDIRAAEANLHAASAAVGVAVADRLPTLTLTGAYGGTSTRIGDLLSHGDDFWSLAAGVTQPLFHGGALLHRQKAAEAALDQAKAQYRSTVIAAYQNVADVLQAIEHDGDALAADVAAEAAARQALDGADARRRLGQVSGAAVLTVQQAYQGAVQARVQAEAARYTDTVALFQALGGGWWNRDDIARKG